MKKAALIYNSRAGHGRPRNQLIERAAGVLRDKGMETVLIPTLGAGSAIEQTYAALADDCDVVFACGGDGTVHEVLQAMVDSRTEAALAILPLGTGNVFANEIGIPLDAVAATEWALAAQPRRVAAGQIRYTDSMGAPRMRYFTCLAGVGTHASMIYQSTPERKNVAGMLAYYRAGLTLLLRAPFLRYEADVFEFEGTARTLSLVDVLAIRVDSFGGILKRWSAGGSLEHTHLHLLVNHGAKRRDLLRFISISASGRTWLPDGVEFLRAERIVCRGINRSMGCIHVQADGEFLGGLPVEISIAPKAYRLLLPMCPQND